jgi:hypothetical protein
MTIDPNVFPKLTEWSRLESAFYSATKADSGEGDALQAALLAKELEILSLRPRTQIEVLVQLRFCAIFLERNGGRSGLAADAIRNAANILSVTHCAWTQHKTGSPTHFAAP